MGRDGVSSLQVTTCDLLTWSTCFFHASYLGLPKNLTPRATSSSSTHEETAATSRAVTDDVPARPAWPDGRQRASFCTEKVAVAEFLRDSPVHVRLWVREGRREGLG